jgi:ABC-type glycerol-3-phosphate transport system substrate-binding protein
LFWGPSNDQWITDNYRAAFDEYEKQNPGVTVRMEGFPWTTLINKLEAAHLSGEVPDLIRLDTSSIAVAAGKGIAQKVTDLIDPSFFNDFLAPSLLPYTVQGEMYGVPVDVSTRLIVYNKKHFEEAGITKVPETFEEFVDTAKKLTKDGRFGYGMGSKAGIGVMLGFAPFLYAAGGDFLNADMTKCVLDSPEGVAAFRYMDELMVKAGVTPPGELERDRGEMTALFDNKTLSMVQGGLWDIDRLKLAAPDIEYGMMMFPGSKVRSGNVIAGWGFVVPTKAEHKEAAAKLLRWLVDADNIGISAPLVISLPGNKGLLAHDRFKGPLHQVGVEEIGYSKAFPLTPKWLDISKAVGEQYQLLLLGQVTPEEAAKAACVAVDQILAN